MEINLQNTAHNFEKKNLTTLKGGYDQLICTKCGLKAKRYGVSGYVTPDGRASNKKVQLCTGYDYTGRIIKITQCTAVGRAFTNITPSSEHEIIDPPKGYSNGDKGVWVWGYKEPVKVLFSEFNYLTPKKK